MLHARTDYTERIQDSACIIPNDEPVFLIRGHDPHGLAAVATWIASVECMTGHDPVVLEAAKKQLVRMRVWQATHKKEPDMPREMMV